MIYLFTWNNEYLVKEEIKKWKSKFLEKFWDFNVLVITNIDEIDKNFISENLLSTSFFNEKKLVIIENIEKIEKDDQKRDFLISILNRIPESNIVVFSSISISEKSVLYKKIVELWEVKRFDIKNTYETKVFLQKKYNWIIDDSAIDKIITYKSNNLSKIVNEIDKLIITKKTIKVQDIVDFIVPELEETIFAFVDKVLNKNLKWVIKDLDVILENVDIYAFYNMFISNIRTTFYILFFKHLWYKSNHIASELWLWNRTFLVDKTYKISFNELSKLYNDLIWFDKNMKFWKLIWSTSEDLKYELQKILINY